MRKLIITLSLLMLISVSCSSDDSSIDECTPIACLNGGTETVDCGCDCPEGFSGTDCSAKLTPNSVTITKVVIKKFPDTDNGNWWDTFPTNSDADIYFTIENSSDETIYSEPNYYEDTSGLNVDYPFTLDSPLSISNVTGVYYLNLFDFDTNTDDFITLLAFLPYDEDRDGFPNTFTVTNSTDTFECEMTVEYTW